MKEPHQLGMLAARQTPGTTSHQSAAVLPTHHHQSADSTTSHQPSVISLPAISQLLNYLGIINQVRAFGRLLPACLPAIISHQPTSHQPSVITLPAISHQPTTCLPSSLPAIISHGPSTTCSYLPVRPAVYGGDKIECALLPSKAGKYNNNSYTWHKNHPLHKNGSSTPKEWLLPSSKG